MFIHLYAIRDLRSEALEFVFEEANDYAASRRIQYMLDQNNPALSMYSKFPEDYALFKIGVLDRKSGALQSDFHHVADFSTYIAPKGE